jgi:ABC-2 type transport system permease protein
VFSTAGNFPLRIFNAGARFAFTFLLPLAFVAYLPTTVLIGRTGELSVPVWLAFLAPLAGVLLFLAAYRLWRYQIRFYASSGH